MTFLNYNEASADPRTGFIGRVMCEDQQAEDEVQELDEEQEALDDLINKQEDAQFLSENDLPFSVSEYQKIRKQEEWSEAQGDLNDREN